MLHGFQLPSQLIQIYRGHLHEHGLHIQLQPSKCGFQLPNLHRAPYGCQLLDHSLTSPLGSTMHTDNQTQDRIQTGPQDNQNIFTLQKDCGHPGIW